MEFIMSYEIEDAELVLLHVALTALIALFPRIFYSVRGDNIPSYSQLTRSRVRLAPSGCMVFVVGVIFYSMAAMASILVRLEGGRYIDRTTRMALIEYWIFQLVLAMHFHVFYNCGGWLLGVILLVVALVIGGVDTYYCWLVSESAGSLLAAFLVWPLYMLCVSLAIMANNSEQHVQRITRRMSSSSSSSSPSSRSGSGKNKSRKLQEV
jgi:tryptophan-rich sensory protein